VYSIRFVLFAAFVGLRAFALAATGDQAAVNVRFEPDDPRKLVVKGATYSLRIDGANGWIDRFTVGDEDLIGDHPLCPIIDSGKVNGPGQFEIVHVGTQAAEIRLTKLWWTDLDADIAIVLYCYPTRVFANATVDVRGEPRNLALGWYGSAKYSAPLIMQAEELEKQTSFNGANPACALIVPPPYIRYSDKQGDWTPFAASQPEIKSRTVYRPPQQVSTGYGYTKEMQGTRLAVVILLANRSHEELKDAIRAEAALPFVQVNVEGGESRGYEGRTGCFAIERDSAFSGATRITARLDPAHLAPAGPANLYFRVRGSNATFALHDAEGFPMPAQLQFNSILKSERDGVYRSIPVKETWFNGPVSSSKAFNGTLHVEAGASVRLVSDGATFATQLGGSDAFTFLMHPRMHAEPSGFVVAEEESAPYISLVKYKANGNWIAQRLERTSIYLTSPKLANFGAAYISNDGKIRSNVEIFQPAEHDQTRCYIKFTMEAMEAVTLDSPDALRLFEATCPPGDDVWKHVTYLDDLESVQTVGIGETGWPDGGIVLAEVAPFVAAHSGSPATSNIGWMINRVEGSFSGKPLRQLALRCTVENGAPHVFFTVPGLTRLEKGDRLEAHLFVMPYGYKDAGTAAFAGKVMMEQREMFGAGLARVDVQHGTTAPGYPRRVRLDANGAAEFDMIGGNSDTPIIIDGFPSYKAALLWKRDGAVWRLLNPGFDSAGQGSHQVFRASDRTYSAIFFVTQSPGETGHFAATHATGITRITQNGDERTFLGNGAVILAPTPLTPDAVQLDGVPFFRSRVTGVIRVH